MIRRGAPPEVRTSARRIRARWAFLPGNTLAENVALEVEGGLIRRVGRPRGGERDLGECLLLPGLVNAHVHLELSGFPATGRPKSFAGWALRLGTRRALASRKKLAAAAARAVEALVGEGVSCIGEVAYVGAAREAVAGSGLAGVWYREIVAPRGSRALDSLRRAKLLARREARETGLRPGLFPHAPYSASATLFREAASAAWADGLAFATHVAETAEEMELFARGRGPLAGLRRCLGARGRVTGGGRSPLAWLDRAGALVGGTALVHATHLAAGEFDLVRERRAAVVVCPRSSAFFGEGPPDLGRLIDAGLPVGLGTDSPASSGTPSVLEEMRALARMQPGLHPKEILLMATEGGAASLGLRGRCGVLAKDARADVAAVEPVHSGRPLESWLDSAARVRMVMLAGRPCS